MLFFVPGMIPAAAGEGLVPLHPLQVAPIGDELHPRSLPPRSPPGSSRRAVRTHGWRAISSCPPRRLTVAAPVCSKMARYRASDPVRACSARLRSVTSTAADLIPAYRRSRSCRENVTGRWANAPLPAGGGPRALPVSGPRTVRPIRLEKRRTCGARHRGPNPGPPRDRCRASPAWPRSARRRSGPGRGGGGCRCHRVRRMRGTHPAL